MEHNLSIANKQNSGVMLPSIIDNFKSIIGTSLDKLTM